MPSLNDYGLLAKALRKVAATGSSGFEGLIQRLLSHLTGIEFYLAQSGSQSGRDMSSDRRGRTVLAVECKRYGAQSEFREDELKGKLVSAVDTIPSLDLWVLAASRPVSDQLYSAIESAASRLNVDAFVLSLDNNHGGTLATLCANAPRLVRQSLAAAGVRSFASVEQHLEEIGRKKEFIRDRDALRDTLIKSAGLHAARARLHEWLSQSFASDTQSRSIFGQVVDVDAQQNRGLLVPRTASFAALDQWLLTWPTNREGLAVLGEEGDGKTWALASWLSKRLKSASSGAMVLWVSSRDASVPDVEGLIGEIFRRRLGGTSERWIERLRRWASPVPNESPLLVLVFDGINERHRPQWWRPIIEGLAVEPWRTQVAAIVTTRTGYWPEVAGYSHITWQTHQLPAYSDAELDVALGQRGFVRAELPPEILPVLRKPRYLDLAVKHRDVMAASGDITVARLIYEDWRDRESRRAGLASETDFRRAIMMLAERQRGSQRLDTSDLVDASIGIEHDALLGELISSGMLVRQGVHWKVEPSRLALGLGLLLVDQLLKERTQRDPAEVLASWLEPSPDMELKTNIVEHAVLHALRSTHCPSDIRTLLIAQWLAMRNQDAAVSGSTAAYFLLDPPSFLEAAESIWSDERDDAWAEEILKNTFERFASEPAARPHLVEKFERWTGFVFTDNKPEDSESGKSLLSTILEMCGETVTSGPFEYAGTSLTIVTDSGQLRLSRLSLAVISCTDRRPYARALAKAFLADALMDRWNIVDLCRWVIRSSDDDLWSLLEPEARRFMDTGAVPAQQAAYRLLTSVGTASALALRETLGQNLFQQSPLIRMLEDDPCTSGLAWRRADCARCAGNDKVPAHAMAQQLATCVRDPSFSVPPNAVSRLVSLAEAVDVRQVWSSVGTTEHDYAFDTIEAVLAGCSPHHLANLVRTIARQAPERRDLPLRQLANHLRRFRLALGEHETELVRSAWETVRQLAPDQERESGRAEHPLFDLLLSGLTANQQLDSLLSRHRNALLYTSFADHFNPLGWAEISARLSDTTDDRDIGCILAFASAHPEMVGEDAEKELVPLLKSPDTLVRFLALRVIFLGGVASAGRSIVQGEWHTTGRDGIGQKEDHWGSLVLAKWGTDLSYDELRARIAPMYIGRALSARGFPKEEVRRFADDLDETWRLCDTDSPNPYPRIEVATEPPHSVELDTPRVPLSEFSRTISFRDRNSTWGGPRGSAPPANFLTGPSDSEIQDLHTRMNDVLAEQRRSRNHWFAQRFSTDGLKEVLAARPELVARWLGEPIGMTAVGRRTWLARGFYEALCRVLFSVDPVRGSRLYKWLINDDGPVTFVDHETGISLLDFALFAADDCEEIRALWNAYLAAAKCDRDLLVVAALATNGTASSWLLERFERDPRSERPFLRIRALRLHGFSGRFIAQQTSPQGPTDAVEWEAEQREEAERSQLLGSWARQWFEKFVTSESDDEALGAFRMFLRCVDSRYLWWRSVAIAAAPTHRKKFLRASTGDIERAVQKNEQSLRNEFLGMRIAQGQVWPWL